MTYDDYLKELGMMRGSRKNEINRAVNNRIPKTQFVLKNKVEEQFFYNLSKEALEHEQKLGFWPTFELYEIEEDDPALDIYR